jgi:hypothetical protein
MCNLDSEIPKEDDEVRKRPQKPKKPQNLVT